MFKKIISLGLTCAMMMGMSTSAFATVDTSTMNKSEFADYVSSLPQVYSILNYSNEDKAKVLSEYLMDGFSDTEIKELENMGIYLYQYETEEAAVKPLALGTPSQVDQEQPAVAYDSRADEWIVVAGGKWNDISWAPYIGGKVGGLEVVGYTFNDSNIGTISLANLPEYTSIVGSLLSYTGSGSGAEVVNYDDFMGDERRGIGCQMQDKTLLGGHYVGEAYAIVVTYDNRFENITGSVRGFYVHTGEEVSFSSISFSGSSSREVTVSVEFSNDEGGFTEYSRRLDL